VSFSALDVNRLCDRVRQHHNYAASATPYILRRMPRSSAKAAPPALHELEAEIMDEVWRQRETTVKRVMEVLNRKTKPPRAYTTYMTVMQRLGDKGLLDRTRSGRFDTYTPALSREEYQALRARDQVQGLVDEFGDVALAHFAKSLQTLDPARRRRLQRVAGQL
jgi:BlaI family transcriptional regulator, penicillinase repressor